jgi:hypothetical protein
MPNTYQEHLIARAQRHWSQGRQLPVDLFAKLIAEGLDVVALEHQHMKEPA